MDTPPSNTLQNLASRVTRLETHLGLEPLDAKQPKHRLMPSDTEQMEPTLLPIMDPEPATACPQPEPQAPICAEAIEATPPRTPHAERCPEADDLDPRVTAFHQRLESCAEAQAASTEPNNAPASNETTEPVQTVEPSPAVEPRPAAVSFPTVEWLPPLKPRSSITHAARSTSATIDKQWWNRFEIFIGAKAMAWTGALVVLLAVSFFVKMAYDNGWLTMPPELRIAIAYLFGVSLLVGGEITLRKLGRAATLALNGAGLGTLYLTTLAASHYFNLMSANVALVLLGVVSGIGILITIRGQLMAIGALSLIGGYAAPFLLGAATANPLALPLYTLALLSVGLVLSVRRDGSFEPLRTVTMFAHGIVCTFWILAGGSSEWQITLGLLSTSCLLVCGASVVLARRNLAAARNCISVLTATSWPVTLGGWFITRVQPADQQYLGLFFAGVAACAGIFATRFGSGIAALRDKPRNAIDQLTLTFWAQLGVLATITIGVQLNGPAIPLGWLALAIFAIELARHLPSRSVAGFALTLLAVTGGRIFGWEVLHLNEVLWSGYGVTLCEWGALALSLLVAVLYAAHRLNHELVRLNAQLPAALSTVAVLMWIAITHLQSTALSTTTLWLSGAIVLLSVNRRGVQQAYLALGTLLLATTTGRWLIADTLLPRLNQTPDMSSQLPFWNPTFGLALAIAATGWWAFREHVARLHRLDADSEEAAKNNHDQRLIEPSCIGTVFFLLFAFSMQLDLAIGRLAFNDALGGRAPWHVLQLSLTLLWTFGSVLLGLIASSLGTHRGRHVTRAAWAVAVICMLKWLLLDTLAGTFSSLATFASSDWPLANLQMLAGVSIAGAIWLLTTLQRRQAETSPNAWLAWGRWMPVGAALLVMWGASFELSRTLHLYAADAFLAWGVVPLHVLSLSVMWALGGLAMLYRGQQKPWRPLMAAGVTTVSICAGVWLTVGTLYPLTLRGLVHVTPIVNWEFLSGLAIAALLGLTVRRVMASSSKTGQAFEFNATRIGAALLILMGLWLGYFEIGRGFAPERLHLEHAGMIRHLAWSIYTGLFAVCLLILGFKRSIRELRYVGLALLVLTLGKVLVVDLSEVRLIYRVLSLLITGLLFVGTSLLYAKRAALLSEAESDGEPLQPEPLNPEPATPQSV